MIFSALSSVLGALRVSGRDSLSIFDFDGAEIEILHPEGSWPRIPVLLGELRVSGRATGFWAPFVSIFDFDGAQMDILHPEGDRTADDSAAALCVGGVWRRRCSALPALGGGPQFLA